MTMLEGIVGTFVDDEDETERERYILTQEVIWLLDSDLMCRTWEGPVGFERLRQLEQVSARQRIMTACKLAHEDAVTIYEWMCAALQDSRRASL